MGDTTATDPGALRRAWMFERSMKVLDSLHVGDAVSVQLVSSSERPYDGDPYKAPAQTAVFVLTRAPERRASSEQPGAATADIVRSDGREAGTLCLRTAGDLANSVLLRRRDGATKWWAWLNEGVPLATRRLEPRNPLSWANDFALSGASDLAGRIYGYIVRGGRLSELAEELHARAVPNRRGRGEPSPREVWMVGAALRALELRHPAVEEARTLLFRAAGLARSGLCRGEKAVPALLAIHRARIERERTLTELSQNNRRHVRQAIDQARDALAVAERCAGARAARALDGFRAGGELGHEGRRAALNAAPVGTLLAVGGAAVVKVERRGNESWWPLDTRGRPMPHPTSRRHRKRDLFLLDRLVRTQRSFRVVALGTGVVELDGRGALEGELEARERPIDTARLRAAVLLVQARARGGRDPTAVLNALLAASPELRPAAARIDSALHAARARAG